MFLYSDNYFVQTYKRFTRFNLSNYVNVNKLIELYNLFIIKAHRKLLTNYINLNINLDRTTINEERTNQSSRFARV